MGVEIAAFHSVNAYSLQDVGRLIELSLRRQIFVDYYSVKPPSRQMPDKESSRSQLCGTNWRGRLYES
jgi:hypothetical protein